MTPLPGTLVVGQSGGPTAVINASLAGVIQEAHRHAAGTGIYGMRHGIEGLLAAGVLSGYLWVVWREGAGAHANTIAFVALVLLHPFQAMNCRSDRLSIVLVGNAKAFVSSLREVGFTDFDVIPLDQLDLTSATLRRETRAP